MALHISLALLALALVSATLALRSGPAPAGGEHRVALVWMCLERCGSNTSEIESQLRQIGALVRERALTAVNFELFNLGPNSTLVENNFTAVAGRLRALGVTSRRAMVSSYPYPHDFIDWMRALFASPEPFITSALAAAQRPGLTGFDVDFEPTTPAAPADAAAFAGFLDLFAKRLHTHGLTLQVDVAPWSSIWNLTAIGQTDVDVMMQMGTYTGNWTAWQRAFASSIGQVPLAKVAIGLETVDPSVRTNPPPLSPLQLQQRFAAIEAALVPAVGLWQAPVPRGYVPFLRRYLAGP